MIEDENSNPVSRDARQMDKMEIESTFNGKYYMHNNGIAENNQYGSVSSVSVRSSINPLVVGLPYFSWLFHYEDTHLKSDQG